ncbi:hypothetical protein BDBG_16402 [Blastomyces gilchristii SLH14081]|uniref:Secretory peptide n=1 Tax=Blastomyces gilchristii (strain SLH14081) TaxID=559298 RepID=A0A179UBH6_BLAGS|nr:uncharacterized protein BDBG_16402 [Blastomyces gilchristii SLH14081]OAT05073.1 hypothetical protein BDBG_16402 [Blastomyces gilchristii SLH14081]
MKISIALLLAAATIVMALGDGEPCITEGAPCGYYDKCCPGLTCHDWYEEGIGKCERVILNKLEADRGGDKM